MSTIDRLQWREPETTVRGSLIVLAGRGESAGVYERFSRRIAFDGYRVAVVAPDSPEDLPGWTPATAAAHARGLLVTTDQHLPRVLIGSDAGATLAVRLAAREEVSALVLAGLPSGAPAAPPADWDSELESRSACPVHRGVLGRAIAAGELGASVAVATPEQLSSITVPVLALHGSSDSISPASEARKLYARLGDVEPAFITDGRHDILNDVSHRSVAAEVVQFLERLRLPGFPRIVQRSAADEAVSAFAKV